MSAAGGVLNVLKRARGELHWTLAATVGAELLEAIATVEAMAGALRAYRRAGFGNSTDFYAQAEAARLADAALSRYHGSAAPAGDGKWLDIPPFLRRDATPEEIAAYEAKQPAVSAGVGDLPEPALDWPTGVFLRNGSRVQPGGYYTADQMRAIRDAGIEYGRRLASAGSASCAECGAALEEVRPGKHQHPTCSQHPSAGSAPAPSAVPEGMAERIADYLCEQEYDIGGRDELLSHVRAAMAAAPTPETQA